MVNTAWLLPTALCRRDHDLAVVDRSVISLQEARAGIRFDAVERAAGDPRDLAVADDRSSVEIVGDHSPHERDVHRLPLAGSAGHVLARRDEAVDAAEMMG